MPLDDVTRRCFPTLAACENRMRRRILFATLLSILAVYVLGRDLLSAYQGRVATQNMTAMVGRVNEWEEKCQKASPEKFRVTKFQAWNADHAKEKERP